MAGGQSESRGSGGGDGASGRGDAKPREVGAKQKRSDGRRHWAKKRRRGKLSADDAGVQGALVSFDKNKKRSCYAELFSLFEDYAERLAPVASGAEEEEQVQDMDLASAISAEVDSIKSSARGDGEGPHSSVLDVNANCMAFFAIKGLPKPHDDAVAFWRRVYTDIAASRKPITLYAHRVIPIQATFQMFKDTEKSMAALEEALKPLVAQHLNRPEQRGRSYAVFLKRRNSSTIGRERVERLVTKLMDLNVYHPVNLKRPDVAVIVEIVCTVGCVSVIEDYDDFYECKFRMVPQLAAKRDKQDAAASMARADAVDAPVTDTPDKPDTNSEPSRSEVAVKEDLPLVESTAEPNA